MSEENVETVRRAMEAAFRKPKPDFATVNALYHSDHVLVSLISGVEGRSYRGAQGFREFMGDLNEVWESWETRFESAADMDDERVLVVAKFSGRSKRAGAPTETRVRWIVTVRNGKLVRTDSYSSLADALEAGERPE